ncbi:type VI secretion system membrane subunit TssM, partial [Pseudomonas syringae]|nr:type VI secretion system membrane subunit TssM [Pseudomonas syringae]
MKSLFKKLIEVLCKAWVWSLLLVFLLAASIWNFGPLLAVSDNRFWEGTSARLITISVLFLVWGLGIVFTNWRGSLIKRQAEESETGKERLRKSVAMEKERLELVSRFSDAQRVLKDSAL